MEYMIAVRGATTVERDTKEEIEYKTCELVNELIDANALTGADARCVSVLISTTKDIHSFYPARAVREQGRIDAPLFSCAEPDIEGALPLCIRVMLTVACRTERQPRHIYLHGAKTLRPDLCCEKEEERK